ncbi:thiamine monophosphate kinase [Gammaproteobacteria bacterium]
MPSCAILGEFELIFRYFTRTTNRNDVICGVGDDGAVLQVPPEMQLVVTTDTLVNGVHFPEETPSYDIGWKSLAVSLSDLAAMGAEPAWITLALTLPEADEAWLQGFSQGLFDLADRHHVALVGGDTTRGTLSISLQAMGFVPFGKALLRSGARLGDQIYVTGTLGDAAIGLDILQYVGAMSATERDFFISRLNRPTPRVQVGLALRPFANAAIDLSDGLGADLGHILKASGQNLGATIYLESLPRSVALKNDSIPWEKIIGGGDDYELCFTVSPDQVGRLEEIQSTLDCPLTWIGQICDSSRITWIDKNGNSVRMAKTGFAHF